MKNHADTLVTTEAFGRRSLQAHRLIYPSETVVRFLSRSQCSHDELRQGLDVGFGSGRHLRTLMDFGYRASGIELCAEAITDVRRQFANEPLLGELHHGDFRSCDLQRESFDVIIFWGAIFLRSRRDVVLDLLRARTLLRTSGRMCINFRTSRNWFYGLGREIEPGYFHLDNRAGPYADAIYAFFDEGDIRGMFDEAGLMIEELELVEWSRNQLSERHSWLVVHAALPASGGKQQ